MDKLLSQIDTDSPVGLRGRAMIEIAYSSALRPAELRRLTLADIDYKQETLFIEQSKGKKDRLVPIGHIAMHWLRRYITEVRSSKANPDCPFVFVSLYSGKQLSERGFRTAIDRSLDASGVARIKPHSLRASAATALLRNGTDVARISRFLGHAHISTTQTYLHLNTERLKQRLETAHPRIGMEHTLRKGES